MKTTKQTNERSALALVEAALARPASERTAFVRMHEATAVRNRALALLARLEEYNPLLQSDAALNQLRELEAPDNIGPYRVLREIGRGGMGTVYLCQRETDEFDHLVAIKMVRADSIKEKGIERLRAERRALAGLNHPCIARFYDGDELPDGTPYFVMEYAEGVPFDQHLSNRSVGLPERLRIFLDICEAVSYAHQNLILHRDLSPSNILVTPENHVKLIDFGISHSLAEARNSPDLAQPKMTMTQRYAAPERFEGRSSVPTDVYSLGVILGEIIQLDIVPRADDLHAIVSKATAADEKKRYASADALAADVRAYIDGRPVSSKTEFTYLVRRFVGRHKAGVAAACVLFIGAVATSTVMSSLYFRADAAERAASGRFEDVRELANFMIFDLHDRISELDGSTAARALLVEKALEYTRALDRSADTNDSLGLEVALSMKRLSDVIGAPDNPNLGLREQSESLLRSAARRIDTLRDNAGPDTLRAYADIYFALGTTESFSRSNYDAGHNAYMAALAALVQLGQKTSFEDEILIARIYQRAGQSRNTNSRYGEAQAMLNRAKAHFERLLQKRPADTAVLLGLSETHRELAYSLVWHVYVKEGDSESVADGTAYDPAIPHFDEAIRLTRLASDVETTREIRTQLAMTLLRRANTTCHMRSRQHEGLQNLDEARAVLERLIELDSDDNRAYEQLTNFYAQKAECLSVGGEPALARQAGETAIERRLEQLRKNPANEEHFKSFLNTLFALAWIHRSANDLDAACGYAERIDSLLETPAREHFESGYNRATEMPGIDEFLGECRKQ